MGGRHALAGHARGGRGARAPGPPLRPVRAHARGGTESAADVAGSAVTAVVAYNDLVAIGLMRGLAASGRARAAGRQCRRLRQHLRCGAVLAHADHGRGTSGSARPVRGPDPAPPAWRPAPRPQVRPALLPAELVVRESTARAGTSPAGVSLSQDKSRQPVAIRGCRGAEWSRTDDGSARPGGGTVHDGTSWERTRGAGTGAHRRTWASAPSPAPTCSGTPSGPTSAASPTSGASPAFTGRSAAAADTFEPTGRPLHPARALARRGCPHDDRRARRRPRRRRRGRVAGVLPPARGRCRHPDGHRGRLPTGVDRWARPARPRGRRRPCAGSAPGPLPSRRPVAWSTGCAHGARREPVPSRS